jgi:hypothetical protein
MGLVVIGSAKAAPGVTTLTVALSALSAEPAIAADLDPDGGDLALRYRRPDGAPLDTEVGLLSLAAALRGDARGRGGYGAPARTAPGYGGPGAGPVNGVNGLNGLNGNGSGRRARLEPGAPEPEAAADGHSPVLDHLQTTAGGLDVLLGVDGPDQAVGLGPLWSPIARALADCGRPVYADCGRLGPSSPALAVLPQADAVVLLARAELEELAHLRERLRLLSAVLNSSGGYAAQPRLGVVLVAGDRDRAAGPRTEQLLRSSGVPVPVIGTIVDDPSGAAKLRGAGSGRAGRTTLVRSVRSLQPAVVALAGGPTLPVPVPMPERGPDETPPALPDGVTLLEDPVT